MRETLQNTAWKDLQPGMRLRFTTPRFCKRGVLVAKQGLSLVILFDGEEDETVLPNARTYWDDHKRGRRDWGLCVVCGKSPPPKPQKKTSDADWVTAVEASIEYGVTAKQLRQWLREGKIRCGHNKARIWVVDRISLGRFLADR